MPVLSVNPSTPKRPKWPWALGIGLLVAGTGIVFIASFLASGVLADLADSRQEEVVAQVVLDFDTAYKDQDCAAFRTLVDDELEDQLVDGDFTCRSWVAIAESLRSFGGYAYSVDVVSAWVEGDLASVSTKESSGDADAENFTYTLERSDDGWVITRYDRE